MADGKLLGIISVNGPKTAAEGQPGVITHWRAGHKLDYEAWLDERRDARANAAEDEREELDRQEEQHLKIGMVKGTDGSLRPYDVALQLEPELADYVQGILDRTTARAAAAATAKEKAERDKAALAAEEKLKADRERARVGGAPDEVNVFDAMVDQV
jgi:hypothetical protein